MKLNHTSLTQDDFQFIDSVKNFLSEKYDPQLHHIACGLKTQNYTYFSLHLDTDGFDTCAEPIAISMARSANDLEFKTIVAISRQGNNYSVSNPCGNCRQIMLNFCPNIDVILIDKNKLFKSYASNLLPFPYSKKLPQK